MNNQEIIDLVKAAITTSSGGQMNQQQLDAFIETTVDQSDFLKEVETHTGIASSKKLDRLGVASRIIRQGTEATAPNDTVSATLGNKVLTPVELIVPVDISYSFLEGAVGGNNTNFNPDIKNKVEDQIQREIAKQFGNDLVDLAWNGDANAAAGSPDENFIKCLDGYLKKANGDSETKKDTFSDADSIQAVFNHMLELLPNKYKNRVNELRFYVSPNNDSKYRDELAVRNTSLGDSAIVENKPVYYKSVLIRPVFAIPDNKVVLTFPRNLTIGFGREMLIERQKQSRKRIIELTMTAKADVNYKVPDAFVLLSKV